MLPADVTSRSRQHHPPSASSNNPPDVIRDLAKMDASSRFAHQASIENCCLPPALKMAFKMQYTTLLDSSLEQNTTRKSKLPEMQTRKHRLEHELRLEEQRVRYRSIEDGCE
eukprot:scaffold68845_cov77-Cyclotella_meneghiniana.AAC.1